MATFTWGNGITGDWTDYFDWGGNEPGSGDAALINAPGDITISTAVAVQSLTIDNPGALVWDQGTLAVGSLLALDAGTLDLLGGTVVGGTIAANGGEILFAGGTLDGVTCKGTIDVSVSFGEEGLYLADSLTMTGAGGSGAGTINVTAAQAGVPFSVYALNNFTLYNAVVNIGNGNYSGGAVLYDDDTTGAGAVLTLGPNVTVNQTGKYLQFSQFSGIGYYFNSGDGIDNQGVINATYGGGQLTINDVNFTNDGSIVVGNGERLEFLLSGSFTNTGSISVSGAGSVLFLDAYSNLWTNTGQISADTGGTVSMGGTYTTAELANFNIASGGTLSVDGTLDNIGATLSIAPGATVVVTGTITGGTITGGTIAAGGSDFLGQYGTLDGVTYQGTIDMSLTYATLFLADSLTMTGAGGSGAGTINLTGDGAQLIAQDNFTLDNAVLNIGNSDSGAPDILYDYDTTGAGAVLTLGPNLTVNQDGQYAEFSSVTYAAGDGIDNQGVINATYAGGQLTINDVNFTNDGSIVVGNGDAVYIEATTFTNLSGNTLTGGTYVVGAGSYLNFGNTATVVTLDADLTLNGAGSQVVSGGQQIESTLTSIGTTGALRVLGGRDYITANAIDDSGVLQLGGGTLDPPPITIEATGKLFGYGVVAAQVVDDGLIEANGGVLDLTQGATGSGIAQVDAGATLQLDAPLASGITLNVQSGGAIDLTNLTYADGGTVSLDPATGILTVTVGTQTYTQNLSGDYTGAFFHLLTDTSGGTEITVNDVSCFLRGTLNRVPNGEQAVESLAIGDPVLTAEGEAQPVLWIGRQTVSRVFADPLRVLPIRITAGALEENMPVRDLLVSPDHALLVGGVLIQAGALVNGSTIRREEDVPIVYTYYHVKLADHALILAEGVPAETFVDNVDRMGFDNWDEHLALYPEGRQIAELPLPRAKSHRQVPMAMRRHLAARAAELCPWIDRENRQQRTA